MELNNISSIAKFESQVLHGQWSELYWLYHGGLSVVAFLVTYELSSMLFGETTLPLTACCGRGGYTGSC